MDVDQQQHSPFASPEAHFSPQLHQQSQQRSPSLSQQQQQQQSPESPSQSVSAQAQGHSQNQWSNPHSQQQQQHSHPHLLPISVSVPGSIPTVSASPTSYSPSSANTTEQYPFYAQQAQSQQDSVHAQGGQQGMGERAASLSLNISSLSVASPANLSPLTTSPHPSTASTAQTLSPVTPLSPSTTPHAHGYHASHHQHRQHHQHQHSTHGQTQGQGNAGMFAYAPPNEGPYNSAGAYDANPNVTLPSYATRAPSSRSSSASTTLSTKSSIPRKRSFATGALPVATLEEPGAPVYNPALGHGHGHTGLELGDVDVDLYPGGSAGMDGGEGSPGDGADSSGDGEDDPFKGLSLSGHGHHAGNGGHGHPSLSALSIQSNAQAMGGAPSGMYTPISAKSTGTNNFVTKLYQMISDPKSALFIQWTELGTSFVVQNVGEFSRTILGAHFKHNNFSSFVRQLNMYGFHKINRGRQTPRGGRTGSGSGSAGGSSASANAEQQQTWEFSHHKFLRGRPDLLDDIKRKALDPDPTVKARVELPGELATQLSQMRESHRRVVRALEWERAKVERLVGVVKGLSEVIGRAFPGSVSPFPNDLWDTQGENPPIFVTSPTAPSPGGVSARGYVNGSNGMSLPNTFQSLQPFSPGSSPTASEFTGQHQQQQHYQQHQGHHLGRAHSMQNIPYDPSFIPSPVSGGQRYDEAMELDPGVAGTTTQDRKRQRTGPVLVAGVDGNVKRLSRARSDSAPLGYAAWGPSLSGQGRPRSGSGLARAAQGGMQTQGRKDDLVVNISGVGNAKQPGTTSPLVPKSGS